MSSFRNKRIGNNVEFPEGGNPTLFRPSKDTYEKINVTGDVTISGNLTLLGTTNISAGSSSSSSYAVTSNVFLNVTTSGSDSSVVRPTVIVSGSWMSDPFLTVRGAVGSLAKYIPDPYICTITVDSGSYAGAEITGFIGGGQLILSGASSNKTAIKNDTINTDFASCLNIENNKVKINIENLSLSGNALDYGVRVVNSDNVSLVQLSGNVNATFGTIYYDDCSNCNISKFDGWNSSNIYIGSIKEINLTNASYLTGSCTINEAQSVFIDGLLCAGCTGSGLALTNINHAVIEATIDRCVDGLYMSNVNYLQQTGNGISGSNNTGYGIVIEKAGNYFLATAGATLSGTLGELYVDDTLFTYGGIIATGSYEINGIIVR